MRTQKRFTLMISTVAWIGLYAVGLGNNGFSLRVNEVSGLDAPWPLVGGLPFAEGALRDADQVRIVDDQGREVPTQIDVTATWRDGSIRWALAGFTASPQGAYRVALEAPVGTPDASELRITERTGGMRIDTGVAVFEFIEDRLLPESASMGEVSLLAGSGDGAYLIDNRGRLGRVTGPEAGVENTFLIRGPRRVVLLREGWYVTPEGERLARARVWFYLSAGSPVVRLTHSLVLTEDTNQLWVRDYGIEFRTPDTPQSAAFALDAADAGVIIETVSGEGETYVLQDTYPHFFDQESRAVVGLAADSALETLRHPEMPAARFWQQDWVATGSVADDWADAQFASHGLTVVMPHLARRFPKEIAVGPDGVRAAFWSGRSGRELDLRSVTLVTEYWQDYAQRAPGGPAGLAAEPSNAQGMARTHDLWLIPRVDPEDLDGARIRATAATQPPLLQSDPAWLTATKAVGWTMHPQDVERFPEQEAVISAFWSAYDARRAGLNFNGFIDWGRHATIRGLGQFFRLTHLVDYGLRTHIWGLYARSGERTYYDYGTGFNRFAGDLEFANWDTLEKYRGGFTLGDISLPLYWGNRTTLVAGVTGDDIWNWALEYYLTGDAYAADRVDMQADAFRKHWNQDNLPERIQRGDGGFAFVRRLVRLYEWTWDDTFADWAREWVTHLIDFDSPNAITDSIRHGPLYKTDRNLFYLSYYYKVTGDEMAQRAFLQSLDYKYRFRRFRGAFAGQSYPAMLYALGYRWSGNPNYLRVVNYIMEMGLQMMDTAGGATSNMHPTQALPAGMALLAETAESIDPFPVAVWHGDPEASRLMIRHVGDGQPVVLRCALRMAAPFDNPQVALFGWGNSRTEPSALPTPRVDAELAFQPTAGNRADPRSWHVRIVLPESLAAGIYLLDFPGATQVDVLESTAPETAVYAPEGFRSPGDRLSDYFRVGADTETLRLFLGIPMTLYRPDGTVAVSDQNGELSIPVKGQSGVWSVRATHSGVMRLFNAEPIFSRDAKWLITGADAEPAPRFEPPTQDRAFVPGPDGQALHLPGRETLKFPRGDAKNGRFAHFPGSEGTVEFWFRPNWSSTDLPFPGGRGFNDLHFLRAGSHVLQYRRGRDRSGEVAALNLWSHGQDTNAGFTGPFGLDAGEWVHVAFTWKTFEGEPGTDGHYAVFVNGEPVAADRVRRGGNHGTAHYWPGRVNGSLPFFRREADQTITIGPMDGSLSRLRVSDVVRYTEPFTPVAALPSPDAHTRAQFPLDGSYTGVCGQGQELELSP